MGSREAIYVDKSTIDFPIFLLFFNTKFPIFPIFSIPSFLFSYFFEQPCCWTPCGQQKRKPAPLIQLKLDLAALLKVIKYFAPKIPLFWTMEIGLMCVF